MALETGTYISDLVVTNPVSGDPKSQGDDHLRLLKASLKTTFPNITGAVNPTHAELNRLVGITGPAAAKDGETYTGTHDFTGATINVVDLPSGSSGAMAANVDYVNAAVTAGTLPGQTGNDDKIMTTDGTTADWSASINTAVVKPAAGGEFVTETQTQTLTSKTLTSPIIADSSNTTKKANFVLSGVTAGQNRVLTIPDNDVVVDTPGWRLIDVNTLTGASEPINTEVFSSTYNDYAVMCTLSPPAGAGTYDIDLQFKIGGSYITTGTYSYHFNNTSSSVAGYVGNRSGAQSRIKLATADFGSESDQSANFTIMFYNVNSTTKFKTVTVTGSYFRENDDLVNVIGSGAILNTGALQGFRLSGTGGLVSGTIRVFGIRKAI